MQKRNAKAEYKSRNAKAELQKQNAKAELQKQNVKSKCKKSGMLLHGTQKVLFAAYGGALS